MDGHNLLEKIGERRLQKTTFEISVSFAFLLYFKISAFISVQYSPLYSMVIGITLHFIGRAVAMDNDAFDKFR